MCDGVNAKGLHEKQTNKRQTTSTSQRKVSFEGARWEAEADRYVTFTDSGFITPKPQYPIVRSGRDIGFYQKGYHAIDI